MVRRSIVDDLRLTAIKANNDETPIVESEPRHQEREWEQTKTDTDSDDESVIENESRRQKRHTKKPYKSSAPCATQMGYYPGQWTVVLTKAKTRFRLHLVITNGFPSIGEGHVAAEKALSVVIDEHEAVNKRVESGMSYTCEDQSC